MPREDGNLCTDAVIKSLLREGWVRASPTGAPQAPAHVRPAGGPPTTVGGFWEGPFLPLGSGTPCVSAAPSGGKRAPGGRPEGWQVAGRLPASPNRPTVDKASRLRLLLPAQRIPETCPPGPVLTPTYLPQAHISGPADPLWQKHKVRRVLLPQGLRAGDEGQTLSLWGLRLKATWQACVSEAELEGKGRDPPPPAKTGLPVGQGCTQVIPATPCPPRKRSTWWGLSWAGGGGSPSSDASVAIGCGLGARKAG